MLLHVYDIVIFSLSTLKVPTAEIEMDITKFHKIFMDDIHIYLNSKLLQTLCLLA